MSNSPRPCTRECREICQAGPKWEECRLTCEVQEEHVSKDCRCKINEKKEWKETTKFKPPTDTTLEEFKKETRFKPPTIPSQET